MSDLVYADGFAMVCTSCALAFKATILPAPLCSECSSIYDVCARLDVTQCRLEGKLAGRKPWAWSKLPGLWSSWDHGDDWAAFDATNGRQVVRRSTEQGGRPWLTSAREDRR